MPTDLQMDALREVVNVGCGHAATALSRLVGGHRVNVALPRVWMRPLSEVDEWNSAEPMVTASFGMHGDLTGQLILVLSEANAHRLCQVLLHVPSAGPLVEPQRGALAEAANIVASACLSAMGGLTGQKLIPSVPAIHEGRMQQLLTDIVPAAPALLVLEASFVANLSPGLPGQLLLLPDSPSVKRLLSRLGV